MGLTLILPKRLAWKGNTSRGLFAGGGGPGKTGGRQSEAKGTCSCPGSGGREMAGQGGRVEGGFGKPAKLPTRENVGQKLLAPERPSRLEPPKVFLPLSAARSFLRQPRKTGQPRGQEGGEKPGLGEAQEQPSLPFASGLWSSYSDVSASRI